MRVVALIPLFLSFFSAAWGQHTRVLVVTGGHDYDTTAFYEMFRDLEGIRFDSVSYPAAREQLQSAEVDRYDVLVFYNYQPEMPLRDSSVFLGLAEKGKPMLFLHHAICTFQQWGGYQQLVGGRYVLPGSSDPGAILSDYQHDLDLEIKVASDAHPITAGVEDFMIHDEGYSNLLVLGGVNPLLTTDHPDCYPVVGWTHHFRGSAIVYLMFGHDRQAYMNGSFRELLNNTIRWLARE